MSRRIPRRRKRAIPIDDARFQRRIDLEHAASSSHYRSTGNQVALVCCPAVRELLEAVDAAARQGHRFSSRSFAYRGRSFPVVLTSLGRVFVKHPESGATIGATSWFGTW